MNKFYTAARPFAERIEKSDLNSLRQLHQALTQNLAMSHYAQLLEHEVQNMREAVDAALLVLEPKPRRCKKKVKKDPVPLDFSGVSEADLFADLNRWPKKPYCTNNLSAGLRIRPLKQAVTMTHIQPNRPHLKSWSVFDIDHNDAENAWKRAGLPPPTWTAINEKNGHAHCAWGLKNPVLVAGLGARDAPIRYLASIESMMIEKLFADFGYSGLVTKNPANLVWRTNRGPQMYYTLDELAACLPGIEKYTPRKREETAGLGRNVTLFDGLRKWAYVGIRPFWSGGMSQETGLQRWNAWLSMCNSRALVRNSDFSIPLNGNEVWHVARSVARWTWQHTTEKGFSDWQSAQGRKGGVASGKIRAAASEDKAASARMMRATGMTHSAIAKELDVHVNSVANWLR